MKINIFRTKNILMATLVIVFGSSCKKIKLENPAESKNPTNGTVNENKDYKISNRGKGGAGSTSVYSDTFILLNFTQSKVQKQYSSEDIRIQYNWSAAGESNINFIELIIDGTTYKIDTISTSSNHTQYHTFTKGFTACQGVKTNISAKLKITYKSGRVHYSSNLNTNYIGGFCCKCWA